MTITVFKQTVYSCFLNTNKAIEFVRYIIISLAINKFHSNSSRNAELVRWPEKKIQLTWPFVIL